MNDKIKSDNPLDELNPFMYNLLKVFTILVLIGIAFLITFNISNKTAESSPIDLKKIDYYLEISKEDINKVILYSKDGSSVSIPLDSISQTILSIQTR